MKKIILFLIIFLITFLSGCTVTYDPNYIAPLNYDYYYRVRPYYYPYYNYPRHNYYPRYYPKYNYPHYNRPRPRR